MISSLAYSLPSNVQHLSFPFASSAIFTLPKHYIGKYSAEFNAEDLICAAAEAWQRSGNPRLESLIDATAKTKKANLLAKTARMREQRKNSKRPNVFS